MMDEPWESWTRRELVRYAVGMEGLKGSTVSRHLNTIDELHRDFGMPLHGDPDEMFEALERYATHYRLELGDDAENRIRHKKDALKLLFRFFGVEHKYRWPKTKKIRGKIILPPDSVVYGHIHENLSPSDNPLWGLMENYMCHLGYVVGPRPGEFLEMRIDGVDFESGTLTWYEPKEKRWRTVHLPDFALSSPVDKSLFNWVEHQRPKIVTKNSTDHLWLNPDTGEPLHKHNFLTRWRNDGKRLWDSWKPYHMRHYAFTRFLAEGYRKYGVFPVYELKEFSNHDRIQTLINYYIHLAKEMVAESQRSIRVGRIKKKGVTEKMSDKLQDKAVSCPLGPAFGFRDKKIDSGVFFPFVICQLWGWS